MPTSKHKRSQPLFSQESQMSAVKSMLYYALSIAIIKGTSLLMLPITTSFVEVEQYGVLNLLSSFVTVMCLILTFGLGEALYRFSANQNKAQRKRVYSWCFTVSVIGCVCVVLISASMKNTLLSVLPLEVSTIQLVLVLITIGFSSLFTVPYAIWRLRNKAQYYFVFVVGVSLTQTVLTIVLLNLGYGIDAVLMAGALSNGMWGSFLLQHFRGLFSLRVFRFKPVRWQYSLSIMLASCTSFVLQGSEQWIIAGTLGATSLAMYFIALQLSMAVGFSVEPYKLWWCARRHNSVENPQINNALFSVLGVELTALSSLAVLGAIPFVLQYLLSSTYIGALEWLGWLCVIAVIKSQAELLNLGCYVKLDGKTPLFINLASAVCMLILCLWLVTKYGLLGVVIAAGVSHAVRAALYLLVSQYLLSQPYNYVRLLVTWMVLITALVAYQFGNYGYALVCFSIQSLFMLFGYHKLIRRPIITACKVLRLKTVGGHYG